MPAPDLYKRAFYFLIIAGTVTLILIALPFVENLLKQYLFTNFGFSITPEGNTVPAEGENPPGMMTVTTVSLIVNVLSILKVILWMTLVISVIRILSHVIFEVILRTNQSEISSLVRTVLSIIIYIVAFFIIFQSQYPSIQLAPLFTGSAILGIVVGLALQDTLGNLFAGLALQADQPFQVGDVISISNSGTGVVESVSWRGVKIRTFQSKLLIISNAVLGKETIEVAPKDNLNARLVFFNTIYTNSPAKTAHAVREAIRQVENVSQKIRPIVRIKNLGADGIDWEIKYWLDDYTKYNDTDALVRQRVWYLFQREKIEFAYPTQTLYIQREPKAIPFDKFVDSTSEKLSEVTIFAPLSNEEIEKLARASTSRVFAPGEAIVRKGQEGNSMFVITRGGVKVQIPQDEGARTINQLRAMDFFGEMSLLTGQPRTATVVADEETEVLEIRKTALKPLFQANPELMKLICEIIEERRALLNPAAKEKESEARDEGGVLTSIRRFFGFGR